MNFLITNPEIDKDIASIKRKIVLSMNGIASENMEQSGLIYKKNYGVAIPRLREIAKEYKPNHDIAQRLWLLRFRETMIMASLLEEPEKFTLEHAQKWIDEIEQTELAEQCVMNIFVKTDFAEQLIINNIESEKLWNKIIAYMLGIRLYDKISDSTVSLLLDAAKTATLHDDYYLYKNTGMCLARLCRRSVATAQQIQDFVNIHFTQGSQGEKFIKEEIKQELEFS